VGGQAPPEIKVGWPRPMRPPSSATYGCPPTPHSIGDLPVRHT